jgi:hypothetical protein
MTCMYTWQIKIIKHLKFKPGGYLSRVLRKIDILQIVQQEDSDVFLNLIRNVLSIKTLRD